MASDCASAVPASCSIPAHLSALPAQNMKMYTCSTICGIVSSTVSDSVRVASYWTIKLVKPSGTQFCTMRKNGMKTSHRAGKAGLRRTHAVRFTPSFSTYE